jgi:hypothetical protein
VHEALQRRHVYPRGDCKAYSSPLTIHERLGFLHTSHAWGGAAASKVKAPKPDMFCVGGTWLIEACLTMIPNWQLDGRGMVKRDIS